MKKTIIVTTCLMFVSLICLPPAAEAGGHYGHGGGVILGFGAGLLLGHLFTPRTVVVSPPVRVISPPVYYAPAPPPPPSPVYGYSSSPPQPAAHPKCREWRLLERRYQDSWDSYYGKWRSVPVEKWGWVEIPCN